MPGREDCGQSHREDTPVCQGTAEKGAGHRVSAQARSGSASGPADRWHTSRDPGAIYPAAELRPAFAKDRVRRMNGHVSGNQAIRIARRSDILPADSAQLIQ
jgi:hypothetical protein